MAAPKTALIFGAGANVGAGLVKGFLNAGYHVATVSRSSSSSPSTTNTLPIQADLTNPATVPGVYARLAAAGWAFPSLVVWNAANFTAPAASDPRNPLEVELAGWEADLGVMVTSPYVAAREAVRGWKKEGGGRGEGTRRVGTFVMTGNCTPRKVLVNKPSLVTLGVGKAGANYWVGVSDAVFREEGIRFFYADQREADGGPVWSEPDPEGHARFYLSLVEDDEVPYYATFLDGKYKEFP